MPSPFPGMDPYLEKHWGDVHFSMIGFIRNQLRRSLPRSLRARAQERVYVETAYGNPRAIYLDVRIVERRGKPKRSPTAAVEGGAIAVAEPLVIHFDNDPITENFVEIVETGSGGRVVSVIEVLSLSNKVP